MENNIARWYCSIWYCGV